jgi:hypothetical protein
MRVRSWGLVRSLNRAGICGRAADVNDKKMRASNIGAPLVRVSTNTESIRSHRMAEMARV